MPRGSVARPLPTEKRCKACHVVKPASEFQIIPYRTNKGTQLRKFKPRCRECQNAFDRPKAKARYVPHPRQYPPRAVPDYAALRAVDPERYRNYEREYLRRRRADPVNSQIVKENAAAYFQANKEAIRLRNKRFRDANPEKMRLRYLAAIYKKVALGCDKRKKQIRAAIAETLDLYRVDDLYWDVYSSELIAVPTIDHIVPLTAGGANDAANFCVTSLVNNSSKNRHSLLLWLLRRRQENDRRGGSATQFPSSPEGA